MQLQIKTRVNQPYQKVFEGFSKELFLKLAPPFPRVKLLVFEGCKPPNEVSLELNFIFFKQVWTSQITDFQEDEKKIFFIDEGKKLPFFLKRWKHIHLIEQQGAQSQIIDDITYYTPWGFLADYLFFPLMFLQFYYRKPIYRKIFK